MATRQSTVVEPAGVITTRKMFGEYGLYCDGKLVGLICDDQLFVKPTDAGRSLLGTVEEASPYPGAKPSFLIAGDSWDDSALLAKLVRLTADNLPSPKAKNQPVKGPAKRRAPPRAE